MVDLLDAVRKMKRHIREKQDEWESAAAKAPSEVIKLSIDKKGVTASDLTGWTDCIPLVYVNLQIVREPPGADVSAGLQGGGSILLEPVGFVIHANAKIGALTAAVFNGSMVDFDFAKLNTANGKTTGAAGYGSTECPVLTNVMRYNSFKFFFVMMQNLNFKEYKFDENGVRQAVSSAADYDAAKMKSKL